MRKLAAAVMCFAAAAMFAGCSKAEVEDDPAPGGRCHRGS